MELHLWDELAKCTHMECQMGATKKGKPLLTGYRFNKIIIHESTGRFETALIRERLKLFALKWWGNCNTFKPFYSFNLVENVKLRELNINWILEQTQPGPRGLKCLCSIPVQASLRSWTPNHHNCCILPQQHLTKAQLFYEVEFITTLRNSI